MEFNQACSMHTQRRRTTPNLKRVEEEETLTYSNPNAKFAIK